MEEEADVNVPRPNCILFRQTTTRISHVTCQRANVEMNNLFEWFCANGLSLNKNKTKYMVFKDGTKNLDFNILDISVGGTHLEQIGSHFQEKTTKFLGVFLDETLSWKYHLIYVKK